MLYNLQPLALSARKCGWLWAWVECCASCRLLGPRFVGKEKKEKEKLSAPQCVFIHKNLIQI